MKVIREKQKKVTGFFPQKFYYAFRALLHPVTRLLIFLRVTPNMVTVASLGFGAASGYMLMQNRLWAGLMWGYLMSFSDIVDGQLAKALGKESRFGGVLDSTIDRYNEFFLFGGLGIRYFNLGNTVWAIFCAAAFLNSVMVSYVKARAEADGFDCNVGMLQRPERITILAIGVAFGGAVLDTVIVILAVGTFLTVLRRLWHVRGQSE